MLAFLTPPPPPSNTSVVFAIGADGMIRTSMFSKSGVYFGVNTDAGRAGSKVNCQCWSGKVYWQVKGGLASQGIVSGHSASGLALHRVTVLMPVTTRPYAYTYVLNTPSPFQYWSAFSYSF